MPLPDIPRELIDLIFDHLDKDIATLGSSSLVCHSWSTSARERLFRKIILVGSRYSRRGIESFRDFISSEDTSSVIHRIEELTVIAPCPYGRYIHTIVPMEVLDLVLSQLPSLRVLSLDHVLLMPSKHDLLGWSCPRSLKELKLVVMTIRPTDPQISSHDLQHSSTAIASSFDQLLNLFSSINHLLLHGICWIHGRMGGHPPFLDDVSDFLLTPGASKISERLAVQKLSLFQDFHAVEMWTAIKDSHFLRTLPVLEIGEGCSSPKIFLRAAKDGLRHISLTTFAFGDVSFLFSSFSSAI